MLDQRFLKLLEKFQFILLMFSKPLLKKELVLEASKELSQATTIFVCLFEIA